MTERIVSASRVIAAPADRIFDLLTDPSRHADFDGSGMVQRAREDEQRLELGSRFGMDMRLGFIPYRINNTVVEFEEGRLIAWAHVGKHRWRYELEPVDEGSTKVTESFDWSTSVFPRGIEWMRYPERHVGNIERTLERLAAAAESS